MSRIQVYCGVSLDGFIAGANDELDWLDGPEPNHTADAGTVAFDAFMAETGVLLMGRRTYDIVRGFDGPWPYGDKPVLVATSRPLDEGPPPSVATVTGTIEELCATAQERAQGLNVYLDGGGLITQALDAGCIDELILSYVPALLGRGVAPLSGKPPPSVRCHLPGTAGGGSPGAPYPAPLTA